MVGSGMVRGKGEVRDRYGRATGCLRDYKGTGKGPNRTGQDREHDNIFVHLLDC